MDAYFIADVVVKLHGWCVWKLHFAIIMECFWHDLQLISRNCWQICFVYIDENMGPLEDRYMPSGHMTQMITSLLRENHVATSLWRNNDVIIVSYARGEYVYVHPWKKVLAKNFQTYLS